MPLRLFIPRACHDGLRTRRLCTSAELASKYEHVSRLQCHTHTSLGGRTPFLAVQCKAARGVKDYRQHLLGGRVEWPQQNKLLLALVELVFSFKPVWEAAKNKARAKILDRGKSIGVDLKAEVETLKAKNESWEEALEAIRSTNLQYPDYYLQAFHGYDDGNLCWQAAFEVTSAAKLVHAPVMDPGNLIMDPDGDAQLRRSYSKTLVKLMADMEPCSVETILDVGCATGISSMELQEAFPGAKILGIDLSPHFLAVGAAIQQQMQQEQRISFKHAAAESTGLAADSFHLVSICLVLHELPSYATQRILEEAFRVLKPAGTLAIMEMDPANRKFQRIFGNPFAYVPFKATEPWLVEYVTTDLHTMLRDIGYAKIVQEPSTPGHFTLAALKPARL